MNEEPSIQTTQESTAPEKPATVSKTAVVKFVTMLVFVMLFVEAICFPLLMLAIDGPDQTVMSETSVEVVPLTPENYWSGEFASSFDGWFSLRYPLRSDIVGTYRLMSIGYDSLGGNAQADDMDQPDLDTSNLEIETDDSGGAVIIIPGRSTETALETGMSESGVETMPSHESGQTPVETEKQTERETTLEEFYVDYVNNYLYAQINSWQLSQKITEPTGYKGSGVLIGKSGYLYEPAYIDEYLGYSSTYVTTAAGLQNTVNMLEYIQDQLNKRGIGFVFCISSSKASQYADYIPDWYKNQHTPIQGYVRAYDYLMPILEKSNLNFVDAKTQYERVGLAVTYAKTGIHWNKLATSETLIQCIKQLSAQMDNRPTRNLAIDALKLSSTPFPGGNPDDDIFNIMWSKQESQAFLSQQIRDKYYFAPKVEVLNSDAPKRNVLFQGGSFVHSLVYYWRNYIGECKQIYYNGTVSDFVNGTAKNPLTDGNEYWEDMLTNIDYVLFEATEQQLAYLGNNTGHWLMYNSLYEYLKNHEIK